MRFQTLLLFTIIELSTSIAVPEPLPLPFSLPDDVKYYPRELHKSSPRHHDGIRHIPAVMKMTGRENEKFYFTTGQGFSTLNGDQDFTILGNQTLRNHKPPFGACTKEIIEDVITPSSKPWAGWISMGRKSGLVRRQVTSCPLDSTSCSNIGRPTSCCPTGTMCEIITNIGYGDVGCCPTGETCSGNLANCASGYTKCVSDNGGGCCQPGYKCSSTGCVPDSPVTSYLTTMPTVATGLDVCETNYYPCPSSFSYGCCKVGRLCDVSYCPINTGTGTPGAQYTNLPVVAPNTTPSQVVVYTTTTLPVPISTTVVSNTVIVTETPTPSTVVPIVVETTGTGSTTTPLPLSSTTDSDGTKETNAPGGIVVGSNGNCPTGFFSCPAQFSGGCCRDGRLCGITDCPATTGSAATPASVPGTITSVITTSSTVGIAGGDMGTCGTGWYQCPSSLNGGCCPSGYLCAANDCPASTLVGTNGRIQTVEAATATKTGSSSGADKLSMACLVFFMPCLISCLLLF